MGMRRRLRSALLVLGLSLTLPAAGGGPAVAVRAATPNRLIDSGSPYLLQHAHNPVEWYPWGPEAIEKARREGKPIFLSIGYSTCYWCHVANRTLYSDPEIAALMNRWFINIKVDREQRPDLDALDMLATTLMTGRSGWPNNLFLTPDLKPIFAGGYFPPEDDPFGRPGFPRILRTIRDDWTNRRAVTEQIAERAAQQMREAQRLQSAAAQPVDVAAWLGAVRVNVRAEFDARHGGFTQAGRDGAKFPRQPLLALLAADFRASQDREALDMLAATLDGMALGGIHDHLGGGFHRYSIEPSWSVPHFEKMLYDNAQLLRLYAEAWQLTKKPLYREVAQRTGAYLLRRLAAPAGGFYTAEDAEVAGKEGASYVWSAPEIEAALGASGAREFFAAYQLTRLAAQREQDALEGVTRGVLRLRAPLPTGPSSSALSAQRAKLLMLREARPQPRRDEKMIVALNGLAIDAFAVAGRILGRDDYVKTAERAARRVWARGEGFLDDYAHFANGLLSLAEAHGAPLWRERAARLADDALRHFARADGSLAMTLAEQELLVAPDESGDTAYPSGTSAAVQLLLRLALEPGGARHQRAAERALAALAGRVQRQPDQWPTLVAAAATMRPGALARHGGAAAAALAPLDSAGKIEAHVSLRRLASHDEVVGRLRIAPGFHVNANPASYKHLVPTAVRLEALEPERVRYPPPRLFKPSFERQELMVYEGEVELVAELKPGAIARPGALRGEVRVQACDDTTCLPPGTVPIALEVR